MNIGLIGSGGREHALCKKIYESKIVKKIVCFPGNAGTSQLAINIDVNILNFKKVLNLIKFHKIEVLLKNLNYWNVELQEAYFSPKEATQRFKELKK